MNKRRALLLSAALCLTAYAQPAPAPAGTTPTVVSGGDPALSRAPVSFNVTQVGSSLSATLIALAKSAGYEIVIEPSANAVLLGAASGAGGTAGAGAASATLSTYQFSNRPFNEVWPLLLDLYGLSYESVQVGNTSILRVSLRPIQRVVKLPSTLRASEVERQLKLAFGSVAPTGGNTGSSNTATGSAGTASAGNAGAGAQAAVQGAAQPAGAATATGGGQAEVTLDSSTLRIVAETASNSLIVRGTNQEVAQVLALLNSIVAAQPAATAQPGAAGAQSATYAVQGDLAAAQSALRERFPGLSVAQTATRGELRLSGTAADVAQATALLGQIDTAQRVYTAKTSPQELAAVLSAQYPALRVSTLNATSQLVLNGPAAQVEAALALLGQIDRNPAAAAASSANQQVYSVRTDQAAIVEFLRAQYPELRVTPVGTTGQLLLSGSAEQLASATTLLGQVDTRPNAVVTVQRIFQLVNASAEEVKATLEGTLASQAANAGAGTGAGTAAPAAGSALPNVPITGTDANGNPTVVTVPNVAAQQATQAAVQNQNAQAGAQAAPAASALQATLIADVRTNKLIVRGTPEQVAQVAELVTQLDQVVPQVNVQVRIQEVSERALNSLGLNWRVNFGGFNVAVGGNGLAASFNPTQSFLGFNVFPTLNALENQGLTRTIYDGNVTMQSGQRSLSSTGGTQNVSNNAAASVKSGGRLEISIPSTSGNIVRQIDYGLNLDFFNPQVAPDGTVTVRVRGQVNQPRTSIPTDRLPNLIDFSNSEAQSTITFRNGQTVLMSGLLGVNEVTSTAGVPVLSRLPVIGAAFGNTSTTKTQTQLLVIITGTVVQ